ncbi:MAG: galactose mutarotase [Chitinophagaceae bacterium]|nr:galactose mutarotase [Chitinophagaceae bacterium]
MKTLILISIMILSLAACNNGGSGNNKSGSETTTDSTKGSSVRRETWGTVDGKEVYLFTLTSQNGFEAKISNYGGLITSLKVPGRDGTANIVLGFDSLKGYLQKDVPYFGALIGRYGNRIAKGRFTLRDEAFTLAVNNGENHLHGGLKGFDKVVWDATPVEDASNPGLELKYLSKDGEEGYAGNLNVTVRYTLTAQNELQVEYDATTDKATPVNLTQHSYFNLTGDPSKDILEHTLTINADKYTPVDKGLIPTGELKDVKGTPFDFTTPHKIGERIAKVEGGYDHNWVLNKATDPMRLVATLADSASGRKIEVYTTEPGLQFYSGNFLDGTLAGSDGKPFNKHAGLCLETQHFPNSPNQPSFPSTVLQPGDKYHTITKYKLITQ